MNAGVLTNCPAANVWLCLDDIPDYESGGQEFESLRARQQTSKNTRVLRSRVSQPSRGYENGRDTKSRNRRAESRKTPEVVPPCSRNHCAALFRAPAEIRLTAPTGSSTEFIRDKSSPHCARSAAAVPPAPITSTFSLSANGAYRTIEIIRLSVRLAMVSQPALVSGSLARRETVRSFFDELQEK
jgi:hypothetical protein